MGETTEPSCAKELRPLPKIEERNIEVLKQISLIEDKLGDILGNHLGVPLAERKIDKDDISKSRMTGRIRDQIDLMTTKLVLVMEHLDTIANEL